MNVRRLTFAVISSFSLASVLTAQGVTHISLRIGLVAAGSADASPAAASVARGVRLGAAEAKQTAALFGNNVDLFEAVVQTAATARPRFRQGYGCDSS